MLRTEVLDAASLRRNRTRVYQYYGLTFTFRANRPDSEFGGLFFLRCPALITKGEKKRGGGLNGR